MSFILAIDQGTTSSRSIIFNENLMTKLVYDYKNGKKKTLKLLALGSLN